MKVLMALMTSFILLSASTIGQDSLKQKEAVKDEGADKIFTKVEQEAKFPGGKAGGVAFLEKYLDANVAANDGAKAGIYTVRVQFIVDREGKVSNVRAIEVPQGCPSCGPETVRVLKKSPRWVPAMQNGKNVIYQAVQHISFQVMNK
jgi:protein TonB